MRVVEIVSESPDHTHVKIRHLHEPLFVGLWEIARDKIKLFPTDLCHDALLLSGAKVGDKYLWGWRETGTTMIRLHDNRNPEKVAQTAMLTCPLENWHLIEATRVRESGHTDGYITWIKARDLNHLKQVIADNI